MYKSIIRSKRSRLENPQKWSILNPESHSTSFFILVSKTLITHNAGRRSDNCILVSSSDTPQTAFIWEYSHTRGPPQPWHLQSWHQLTPAPPTLTSLTSSQASLTLTSLDTDQESRRRLFFVWAGRSRRGRWPAGGGSGECDDNSRVSTWSEMSRVYLN